MPVVPICLNIDGNTCAGVRTGVLELYSLAKNVDNKRVAKHIPAVADAAKEGLPRLSTLFVSTKGEHSLPEV